MSIKSFTLAALALTAVLVAAPAAASGSRSVTVNATIVPVCRFFTNLPVINIRNTGTSGSNIDPSLATVASGNVGIAYRCSTGTAPTFTLPASAALTCAACTGLPTMTTTITSTSTGAGLGMGTGRNRTLTVTGRIAAAVYQNARVGAYSGTMTVTVTP